MEDMTFQAEFDSPHIGSVAGLSHPYLRLTPGALLPSQRILDDEYTISYIHGFCMGYNNFFYAGFHR